MKKTGARACAAEAVATASRRRGMTLLEVMIAIVVFVMAISAILPLFAVGTTSHRRGMDQARTAWVAARIAARIQEGLYDPNPRDIPATEETDGGMAYIYSATFKPLGAGAAGDPLAAAAFLLRVQVRRRDQPEDPGEVFETVVLRRNAR